jgi:aspartate racemase
VKASGIGKVLLLGTKTTMSAGFYNKVASKFNLDLITPNNSQQEYIHEKYLSELLFNDIKTQTKQALISIVTALQKTSGAQGLILGGTELPLILSQADFNDIKVFDSGAIHADAIVALY